MMMSAHLGPAPEISSRVVRSGHFGAWQAVTSLPAMVGSLLLLLVLFGWTGDGDGFVLLGWLASGAAIFSRAGERAAVVLSCGFRRRSRGQDAALETAWSGALAVAGLTAGDVDLYVRCSGEMNAYAVGGRSVAITTGVLQEFREGRLGANEIEAVLVHELGHQATRATKFALLTMWLALPWRFASRLVLRLGQAVGPRQPSGLIAAVVGAAVVIAVVHAVRQRQWAVAVVLSAVVGCAVVCPLASAAVSRRSEYAADQYAAATGQGPMLAASLCFLDGEAPHETGLVARLLTRHPPTARRIALLNDVPGGD